MDGQSIFIYFFYGQFNCRQWLVKGLNEIHLFSMLLVELLCMKNVFMHIVNKMGVIYTSYCNRKHYKVKWIAT